MSLLEHIRAESRGAGVYARVPLGGEAAQDGVLHVTSKPVPGLTQSRTVSAAAARARPGDTVAIHGGVHRETVRIETSGR